MKRFLPLLCIVLSACAAPQPVLEEKPAQYEPWVERSMEYQDRQLATLSHLGRNQDYADLLSRLQRDIDPSVFAGSPLPPEIAQDHLYRESAIQLAAIGMTAFTYDTLSSLGYDMGAATRRFGSNMLWQDKVIFSEDVTLEGRDGNSYRLRDESAPLPARAPATGCVRYRSPSYRSYKAALDAPHSPDLLISDCIGQAGPNEPLALSAASEAPPSLQAVLDEVAKLRAARAPRLTTPVPMPMPMPEDLTGSWRVTAIRTTSDSYESPLPPIRITVTGPNLMAQSGCVSWLFLIDRTGAKPQFIPQEKRDVKGNPVPMCARGFSSAEESLGAAVAQVNSVTLYREDGRRHATLSGPRAVIELRR